MRRLALVRHAKSDWGAPMLADHDRPLNRRGMRDAPAAAARLAATGFRPDVILCSTALRARATADAFGAALGVAVTADAVLYAAAPETLLRAAIGAAVPAVLLVGHDPGMSLLAERLSDGRIDRMPTCAVAVFEWDQDDWAVATALPADRCAFDAPGIG